MEWLRQQNVAELHADRSAPMSSRNEWAEQRWRRARRRAALQWGRWWWASEGEEATATKSAGHPAGCCALLEEEGDADASVTTSCWSVAAAGGSARHSASLTADCCPSSSVRLPPSSAAPVGECVAALVCVHARVGMSSSSASAWGRPEPAPSSCGGAACLSACPTVCLSLCSRGRRSWAAPAETRKRSAPIAVMRPLRRHDTAGSAM